MDDRGCMGRMARKCCPVRPATSILPSGSLATSFTKPIPQWDETDIDTAAIRVQSKGKDKGYHDIHLQEDVNYFIFFCVRKQDKWETRTQRKDREQ